MIGLALRMLFGERAKYLLLLSGIAAATVMMIQGIALGFGVLSFSYATADNVRSPIWVVDPAAEHVGDNQPLRETDVNRVRSVDGVAWAAPLFVGMAQVKMIAVGMSKEVTLVGLDSTTLLGAPARMLEGSLEELRFPDAVIVDESTATELSPDPDVPLRLGDTFEMNDRTARIVGICFAKPSFGGGSYVFTTYDRAVQYVPGLRKMVTHILTVPGKGKDVPAVAREISRVTGLKALTEDELKELTVGWMFENSPAPFVIAIIVVIGFVVGTIVSGQTFYSFVLENSRYLGALRAMGTGTGTLAWMILVQASFVGLVGYGLGLGLISGLFLMIPEGRVPLLMLWPAPASVLAAILGICLLAALLGIRRMTRLEPALVFRS
jgi:putative ABC transport system permease protein